MKKGIILLYIVSVIFVFFAGCNTQYISFKTKNDDALKLYRKAILDPANSALLINMFYSNKRKYSNRIRGKNSPIQVAALDQVSNQLANLKKVDGDIKNKFKKYFTNNSCCRNSEGVTVFARELLQPQTEYSHFATPFRNKSYVFYIFTDYDASTGTGKYYQTDAFYPRDAFSFNAKDLCPANFPDTSKLEFFTGIFYLSYIEAIQKNVVSLLSPINDFNDRKVFIIDEHAGALTFTKAYEYKIDNFYPIQYGNYTIVQKGTISCGDGNTRSLFKKEIEELWCLKGAKASVANVNLKTNVQMAEDAQTCDSVYDDKGFRDYPYPLKENSNIVSNSGWVFLGITDGNGNVTTNETFYRFKKKKGTFPDYNREIKSYKALYDCMDKGDHFRPFEVMKMRSVPYPPSGKHFYNWDDPTIIGEAYDDISYRILEDTLIQHFNKDENKMENMIWMKIEKVEESTGK